MAAQPNSEGGRSKLHLCARWLILAGSSTKVAVALIVVLVFVPAWTTVLEGSRGRAFVEYHVYQSWWFNGIFVLMFVNVLGAMLVRWPWSRRQVAFVTTHVGLLLLLAAMMWALIGDIHGTVDLEPGMPRNSIELTNRSTLEITRANGRQGSRVLLSVPDVPMDLTSDAFQDRAVDKRLAIRVVDFRLPTSLNTDEVDLPEHMGAAFDASALVELRSGDRVEQIWLTRNGGAQTMPWEDGGLEMQLASQQMKLGFAIQLLSSRDLPNPGGTGVASSISQIRLFDNRGEMLDDATVATNRPARYRGYRFVHRDAESTVDGTARVTLTVTKERGRILKYVGLAIVCLGMLMTVVQRPKSRALAAQAGGPPGANRTAAPDDVEA